MKTILTDSEIWKALGYDHPPAELYMRDARAIESLIIQKIGEARAFDVHTYNSREFVPKKPLHNSYEPLYAISFITEDE